MNGGARTIAALALSLSACSARARETELPAATADAGTGAQGAPDAGARAPDAGAQGPDAGAHAPDAGAPAGLPTALPFAVTRPDDGDPVPAADTARFTRRITGLWKKIDFFRWVLRTSHGMDASTGLPDYAVWWHDVDAVKTGDLVTFRHSGGGAHNIYIPTSRVLAQAAAGLLLTGDAAMARVVEQYAKGVTASMDGMVWDAADPAPFLMARNIVNHNHAFTIEGGKRKAVDYAPWYTTYEDWNAHRVRFPHNPTWGDVYVTNMRSKDDVPHILEAAAWLRYVAERATDAGARDAARVAWEHLQGWARDVVESGYRIRTKDAEGHAYAPDEDLASFVWFDEFLPGGECTAKIAAAIIGTGGALGNNCDTNNDELFEHAATVTHYYNYAIYDNFHIAALMHALIAREDALARKLMDALLARIARYEDPASDEPGKTDGDWSADRAVFLLQSSAAGLPLTANEVRLVQSHYDRAVATFESWDRWDLWAASVPDGTYSTNGGFRPDAGPERIRIEDIAFVMQYCASPFRNAGGAAPVDCAIVADPARWGETP